MKRISLTVAAVVSLAGAASSVAASQGAPFVPASIAFWDRQHGLIGGSFGYCPRVRCTGAVMVTDDGGRTSRVVLRTSGAVSWVAVATGSFAWALVEPGLLLRSVDGGRSWHGVAFAGSPSFADGLHGFGILRGLVATADGGKTWRSVPSPCPGETQGVSAVGPSRAWLLCTGQPGAGNQGKAIYRTDDRGRSWSRLLSFQMGRSAGGLSSYGYALGISFDAAGTGVIWESRGTLYATRDGGRQWQPLEKVARPEIDFGLSGSVVSDRALVLLTTLPTVRLVAGDGTFRHWRTVRTWRI